jgi:HAD superfamily hydrolase (TIGR01450 family)
MNVVSDVDGVLYRGSRVLPGVPEALLRLREAGARLLFVTNNSTRSPEKAAERISELTGVEVTADEMCTSPMAAVRLLGPDDRPVFVVGEDGITSTLETAGVPVTGDATGARAVMVGLTPRITYEWIGAAADAVRRGARFIATNSDPTYPMEDRLLPGAGAIVSAIATAAGREPEIAGKPHPPMVDLVRSRLGDGPIWVVGDRVDTDIALARAGGWRSVLVMGGVTEDGDGSGADFVADGFAAAVETIISQPAG